MKKDGEKSREDLVRELDDAKSKIAQLQIFASLVDDIGKAMPDSLLLIDEDGNSLETTEGPTVPNRQAEFHRNYKLDEEQLALQKQAIREAIRARKPQVFEFTANLPEGNKIFERRIAPLKYRGTRKSRLILITRDITVYKDAEEKLIQSERSYRTVVESIPERIILKNRDHIYVSCNSLFSSYFGKTPEEVVGLHTSDLYEPELAARLIEADTQIIETGEPRIFIDTMMQNGSEVFYESLRTPVRDSSGNIIGVVSVIRDVTEQRHAEEALRFSDAAFKSIHECVYAMDIDFRVTYWNHICEELFGVKADEVMGRYIGEFIKMEEEYPGQNTKRLKLLMKQGHDQEEQVYLTRNGRIWVDVFAQAIEHDGQRYGWITLANDITERKRAEENLRVSEERFSKAFRSVPDSIIISRIDNGLYLEVNDSFTELTGYSREEIIGKTAAKLGVWDNMKDRKTVLSILEREGRVENYEHQFRKKSGETGTGLITVDTIDIGGTRCMISVLTDITERKKAEDQLRYQASLVENISDAVLSHDQDLKIMSWNKAAERIFRFDTDNVLGQDIRELCRIEPVGTTIQSIRDTVQKNGSWRGEAIHHQKNGESFYLRISSMMVKSNETGKTFYVLIMSDITEEKKAEEELKQLYEKEIVLRHEIENEMKKRSEFSSAIVHELKTPLTAIISSSDLLLETIPEGSLERLGQNINRSAYELDKRINELLDMARGELEVLELDPKPLDLLKVIRTMEFNFYTLTARKSQFFKLDLPDNLPVITADESRLRQVISNLVNNAVKYTASGGTITLKVKKGRSEVTCEIRDTGSGLTPSEQASIFQPYQQLIDGTRAEGGMGLGLAIARNIITAHGGKIWVESRKGKGSSFFFTIPL